MPTTQDSTGRATTLMAHPDHIASWTAAVEHGLIDGDPQKYYDGELAPSDYYHALIVSTLETQGIDWRSYRPGTTPDPTPTPEPEPTPETTFGTRPAATGVIHYSGQDGLTISNLHFDGQANSDFVYDSGASHNAHVCILLTNCTNITIENCDFEDVSEPIAIIGGSDIIVQDCRVNGIVGPGSRVGEQTGNFLQTVSGPERVTVRRNKIIATTAWDPWSGAYETMTEDVISFFSASDCVAEDNWIDATGYVRDYGTGIIAGDSSGSNVTIRNNRFLNPGQVGIAIAGDPDHLVHGNWIWKDSDQNPGSGNTAAYCWDYNGGTPTNNVVFSNNRAKWNSGGGFWNPGPPPATEVNNDWDDDSLSRSDVEFTL